MQRNRILIVDDSRVVRVALTRMLAGHHAAIEADSGEVAWDHLLSHPDIGVVFTDQSMPGIDGEELLRRIRAGEGACAGIATDLPVVMITGQDGDADTIEALLKAGANAVLSKPFEAKRIHDLVAQLLKPPADPPHAVQPAAAHDNDESARAGQTGANADEHSAAAPDATLPPAREATSDSSSAPPEPVAPIEPSPESHPGAAPRVATASDTQQSGASAATASPQGQAIDPPETADETTATAGRDALQAEIAALKSELLLRQLTQNERGVQREVLQLRQNIETGGRERTELQQRLEHAETELERLGNAEHERAKAAAEIVRLEQEVVELTATRTKLLDQIAGLYRSEADLRDERDALRQQHARTEAELRAASSDRDAAQARLQALTERFEARERQLEETEQRLAALQEQVRAAEERDGRRCIAGAPADASDATAGTTNADPRAGSAASTPLTAATTAWPDARHIIDSPRRHWVRLALLASLAANLLLTAAFLIVWFVRSAT